MMNDVSIFLASGALILACMTALWLLSLAIKNAAIVDIFWGTGFVLVTALGWALTPGGDPARKLLLLAIVAIWGLRLSGHIFLRNHNKPEDFRYAAWRLEHGPRWWWRSYLQVFLLQGALMWVISTPLLVAQISNQTPFGWLDIVGAGIWLFGFFFEAGGDYQLSQFKKNPANKGKLLTTGLWRYTRHPNYFGDAAQWWGFYLIALSAGGWWTIFSPLIMTYLLMRVSGVAMLERTMSARPGYEDYMRRTNAFFPWLPRK